MSENCEHLHQGICARCFREKSGLLFEPDEVPFIDSMMQQYADAHAAAAIEPWREYVTLLCEEMEEILPFAVTHGWKTKRFEEGARLRDVLGIEAGSGRARAAEEGSDGR
jgi:hypothetical protein